MGYNQEYVHKRGEVGNYLEFTLRDDNGPVNMTDWTLTISARKGNEEPTIEDEPCVLSANQTTTGKGQGYYEFTSETADIPPGHYKLEFKGVSPAGEVFYFPKSKGHPFASLIVIEPLT